MNACVWRQGLRAQTQCFFAIDAPRIEEAAEGLGVKVKRKKALSHQSFIAIRRHREATFAVLGTDQSGATESTFAERKGLSAVGREPRPKGPVE